MAPSTTEDDQANKKFGLCCTQTSFCEYIESARNLVAFWLFGLSNNFGYVIMLSAAYDILEQFDSELVTSAESTNGFLRECNTISTGSILLANIIPSFIIKILVPFIPLLINIRMVIVVVTSALGFLLVASGWGRIYIITGVACVSFSSGLGESTLLAYTVFFKTRNVISTWSSGTGAAGILGSFAYSLLIDIGLSPRFTMIAMLIMPLIMSIWFWLLLDKPCLDQCSIENSEFSQNEKISLRQKLHRVPKILLIYTLPYGLVYFFEYFINQGLFELMYFPNTFLNHEQQYRWYNSMYQAGVFVARSSMNIVKINNITFLALLQGINVLIFTNEVLFGYLNYIPIAMVLIFWEGLLGGASYVNTFRKIASEIPSKDREFSMALNAIGDSIMITLAGVAAIPVHNIICRKKSPYGS